jgi:hypothetical protein
MHTFSLYHNCKIDTARFEEGKGPSRGRDLRLDETRRVMRGQSAPCWIKTERGFSRGRKMKPTAAMSHHPLAHSTAWMGCPIPITRSSQICCQFAHGLSVPTEAGSARDARACQSRAARAVSYFSLAHYSRRFLFPRSGFVAGFSDPRTVSLKSGA